MSVAANLSAPSALRG